MFFTSGLFSLFILLSFSAKASPVGWSQDDNHAVDLHYAPNVVLLTVTEEITTTSYHIRQHSTTVTCDDSSAGQTSTAADTVPNDVNTSPPASIPTDSGDDVGVSATPTGATPASGTALPSSSGSPTSGDAAVLVMHTGDATVYAAGLGACGITNTDADLICAIGHDLFDSIPAPGNNPNKSPFCNRQIKATIGPNTVTVTVTDRCTGCAEFDLDFSTAAATALGFSDTRIHNMTWEFIS